MSKVLITGITGFIGGEIARKLVEKEEVHGLCKPSRSRNYNSLKDIQKYINLHELDISDYSAIENLIKNIQPDKIIHLAALSPVRASFDNPLDYNRVNATGTLNIVHSLQRLKNYKERRIVIASTAEVYGLQPNDEPFKEELPLLPSSPYACMKAYNDMYLRMMHNVMDFNVVILRCVNTYGRKYDKSFFIEYLINEMLNNKDVYIGAPNSIRDYMWVEDHVNAYLLALNKPAATGHIFNVSTGVGIKNIDVAYKIANIIGFDRNKIHSKQYPSNYPNRPITSDQPYLVLNSDKIKKELGWKYPLSLEEGLRKAINYWKSFK